MRLVTVLLGVVAGGRVGVVLVNAAALLIPLPVEPARSGSGAAGAQPGCPGSGQTAVLVCSVPALLVALTRVRPTRASVRVTLAAALGPALSKGDDVAEGPGPRCRHDAGSLGDA